MRNALTILVLTSLVISLNVQGSFLELDDLRDMITDQAIRNDLRRLERDRSDPRSAVKDEVEKLLQKLPKDVQVTSVF
ncbi:unnamed protein product [Anisakis simplex]|uniref:Uncharacterized protein n=1 Tax=Anisakis simplex TaxID=6269 RepID=A0A0M3JNI0_ANISI|nr:unnamed protein product [Anisakis simplex]